MRKISRYIGKNIFAAISVVLFVIVALDVISEFVDQLTDLEDGYTLSEAAFFTALTIPASIYDFIPLSALVGCLIGLGMLASTSELTVIRVAGVSIRRIVWIVFKPVVVFVAAGAFLGEFVAPYSEQYANSRKALAQGSTEALDSDKGLWNREGNEFMHFNAVLPNGKLFGITRYTFDRDESLISAAFAKSAIYQDGYWVEEDVEVSYFDTDTLRKASFFNRRWDSELTPEILNVLVLSPDELPMQRLHRYSQYLEKQNLDSSDYRLAFWQKFFQPLATFSLVVIAISFILGPLRQVTMGFRVFIGVIIGLVFRTSQNLLGPMSIIYGFAPMYAVLLPIGMCFFIGWLFLKRSQ